MTNINNVLRKLKSMSILSFDEGKIKKSKRKTIVKRGVEFKKNITIPSNGSCDEIRKKV